MKKLLAVVLIAVCAGAGYVLSKPDNLWMAMNYFQAKKHADKLLAGSKVAPPPWAGDMVISSNAQQQLVMFTDKQHQRVYAYSPYSFPQATNLRWHKIWQAWYVGKP